MPNEIRGVYSFKDFEKNLMSLSVNWDALKTSGTINGAKAVLSQDRP